MPERWFRFYDEALNDPKVQLLDPFFFKAWVNLLCLSSKNSGSFSSPGDVSFALRCSPQKAAEVVTLLCGKGLLDRTEDGKYSPHNWKQRQFQSDITDPTAADRMRNYRIRKRNGHRNDAVTVTDSRVRDTESDSERKKDKKDTADAVTATTKTYAFESGVIRLNQKDFDNWKSSFSYLDVPAELIGLTKWASEQGNKWFFAISSALAKKNREMKVSSEQAKRSPAAEQHKRIEEFRRERKTAVVFATDVPGGIPEIR